MTDTGSSGKKPSLFKRFPSVFWIVQIFELMERGAYYSMMPILAVHFIYNVGIPIWLGLILAVFMYPFQYGMPIFSSALAEKVGYRKQMLVGFTVLFFSYIFLAFANNWIMAILGVMMLGFGIGTYKPLVSSTIAKATPQADRNVAYSIYYWTVNLAATFFALGWGLLLIFKILTQDMYAWVFGISSVYFIVNIFVAFFIFKEIPRSGEVKTVRDVGSNIATAFKDRKFVIMMLLMAGFWALYSASLAPFQTIMYGFHFLPESFPVILLGVFNPATIILLGIPLSKFVERLESLKVLILGVLVYIIGLIWVSFTMQTPLIAVWGIVIYSIGEFMVAPGYLAFVSKLAPKEKVSAYIGCNFLATFTGIFGGALIFGLLTNFIAVGFEMPHFFYGIIITIGALILFGFLVYYHKWGKEIIERSRIIKQMEEGTSAEDRVELPPPGWTRILNIFDKKSSKIIPMAIIPVALIGTFIMGTSTFYPPVIGDDIVNEPGPFVLDDFDVTDGQVYSEGGSLEEDSQVPVAFTFNSSEGDVEHKLKTLTITLTWTDEEDINRLGFLPTTFENQGDSFALEAVYTADPNDETTMNISSSTDYVTNNHGSSGVVTLTIEIGHSFEDSRNGTGDWNIIVKLGTCGNYEANRPAVLGYTDSSNDFEISIETEIYIPKE